MAMARSLRRERLLAGVESQSVAAAFPTRARRQPTRAGRHRGHDRRQGAGRGGNDRRRLPSADVRDDLHADRHWGFIAATNFAFTARWGNCHYPLTFLSTSNLMIVSAGIVGVLVQSDVLDWGRMMAVNVPTSPATPPRVNVTGRTRDRSCCRCSARSLSAVVSFTPCEVSRSVSGRSTPAPIEAGRMMMHRQMTVGWDIGDGERTLAVRCN
jgi:hypothetical protein